jgi:hypothetical protein
VTTGLHVAGPLDLPADVALDAVAQGQHRDERRGSDHDPQGRQRAAQGIQRERGDPDPQRRGDTHALSEDPA